MAERMKMPRENRAAQFAPFDALKGLQEALRYAEYEHERTQKGDISQEQAEKISNTLSQVEKNTKVSLKYYYDGYKKEYTGKINIDVYKQEISTANNIVIPFDNVLDIEIVRQ